MGAIFISYRREDTEGHAGRLFEDLVEHFGAESVFMDVAGIAPGRDFRKVIDTNVANCSVLLAVIGKRWLEAKDEVGKRRIDDPADFVRLETASALKRDIPVVPVLVQGATMPRAEQLPAELADLAFRNAVELSHARWGSDVEVLAKALRPYMPQARPPVRPVAAESSLRESPAATSAVAPAASGPSSLVKPIVAALIVAVLGLCGYVVFRDTGNSEQTTQIVADRAEADRLAAARADSERMEAAKRAEEERKAEEERRAQAEQLARQQQAAEGLAAKEKALEAERARLEEERAKATEAARRADEERKKAEATRLADEQRRKAEGTRLALAEDDARKAEAARAGSHPSGLRSIPGTPATTITFANVGERAVNVYWITFEGKEQLYFKLAPGQSYDQATGISHAWIVRDASSQRQVATAVGASGPTTVRIGEPRKSEEAKQSAGGWDLSSVKRVAFSDGSGRTTGYFRFAGSGNWVETGPAGNDIRYKFQERGRDESSIHLVDRSRDVAIQLDLNKRVVMYQDGKTGKRWALYEITGIN